jgi:hypothetical protein
MLTDIINIQNKIEEFNSKISKLSYTKLEIRYAIDGAFKDLSYIFTDLKTSNNKK